MSKGLRELAVELHIDAATKGLLEDAGRALRRIGCLGAFSHSSTTASDFGR